LRIRGLILFLSALVMSVACRGPQAATCSGSEVQLVTGQTLTVGADLAYPPFGFEDPKTHEPTGFELDLVRAVAKELGLKVSLVNRTSSALLPGLLAHRHDVTASGLIDTAELRDEVCVSAPYLDADFGLARRAQDESISGTGDLDARVVGVVRGGRAHAWAKEHLGRTTRVSQFETSDDLLVAVRESRVDAVIDDLPVLRFGLRDATDASVVDVISTRQHYVLGAHPSNGALIGRIDKAIEKLEINGTLDELRKRWFGI
jgi:ABC-type amino acid transport substrate-binding protein